VIFKTETKVFDPLTHTDIKYGKVGISIGLLALMQKHDCINPERPVKIIDNSCISQNDKV